MEQNKQKLRDELTALGVAWTESDGVEALEKKLTQAKQLNTKDESALPFTLMDLEDENQILSEISGAMLDVYMYSFTTDGKLVVGLSKAGVDQICRESSNKGEIYRVIDSSEIEEQDYWRVKVTAGRYLLIKDKDGVVIREQLIDTKIGVCRQWKKTQLKGSKVNGQWVSGKLVENKFAYTVAYSKAQRNALRALLPYKFIEEMMSKFKTEGKFKAIDADKVISEKQLKYLHQVTSEHGIDHDKLTELIKEKFGYEHTNELKASEMDRALEVIKENVAVKVVVPFDLKKKFDNIGYTEAKAGIYWGRELNKAGGNEEKARVSIEKFIDDEGRRLAGQQ